MNNLHGDIQIATIKKQLRRLLRLAERTFPEARTIMAPVQSYREIPSGIKEQYIQFDTYLREDAIEVLKPIQEDLFQVDTRDPPQWTKITADHIFQDCSYSWPGTTRWMDGWTFQNAIHNHLPPLGNKRKTYI